MLTSLDLGRNPATACSAVRRCFMLSPTEVLPGLFQSPVGQDVFLRAYDDALALWPVPFEERTVLTAFGPTHVVACGPQDAPPLVLLHGMGLGAPMWFPNVAAWSTKRRIYAPDTIGDIGRSFYTRPPRQPGDYVTWLSDVLDGLGVDRTDVLGLSYGGFVAATMAIHSPQRVRRLVLVDPAAVFAPLRPQFYLRALPSMVWPVRPSLLRYLDWFLTKDARRNAPRQLKELWVQGWKHFRMVAAMPRAYTDAELQHITAPTLLMLGEREVIYPSADAVIGRALRVLPNVEVAWVHGAVHVPTLEQPAWVNPRVLRFLLDPSVGPDASCPDTAALPVETWTRR
jgi:pimeloyl-ACP methyl ester carboxylesterase